jgi:hypothetical protein
MARTATRLEQEAARLRGHYAYVLDESIDSRHDGATGEVNCPTRSEMVLSITLLNRLENCLATDSSLR